MKNLKPFTTVNEETVQQDPKSKYPELDELAEELASEFAAVINKKAKRVQAGDMKYPVQYVLEQVIKNLQEKV